MIASYIYAASSSYKIKTFECLSGLASEKQLSFNLF